MIFIDTSFFYALMDERDFEHDEAVASLNKLESPSLVTTNHVRGESWALVNRRLGHAAAARFLSHLESSPTVTVEWVDQDTEADAIAWLHHHSEREYSFIDATSFAFMRDNRITEALAFDGDFTAAGFVELRS